MKKLIFFLVLSGYLTAFGQTQSEQTRGMNFQGAAYDGSGKAMPNLSLNVKITLSSKDPEPVTYYTETHLTTTNELGVFHVVVGNGTQRAGEISAIPWADQQIWVDVDINSLDKRQLNIQQSMLLRAVPYAFHAETADQLAAEKQDLEKSASAFWNTKGNDAAIPPNNFLGTTDNNGLVFKLNNKKITTISKTGQVSILSAANGADNNPVNYPLKVSGTSGSPSTQGIYIQVNTSRSNATNFVNFGDADGFSWGAIQGQTTDELHANWEYQLQISLYSLTTIALTAQTISTAAEAVGLYTAGGAAVASIFISWAAPGFFAAAVGTTLKAVALGVNAASLGIDWTSYTTNKNSEIGVEYSSGSGDYAEWLRRKPNERVHQYGEIVGIKGGLVSLNTLDADQVMVVSRRPIVLGNAPQPQQEKYFEKIAFLGQVPVRVLGTVAVGDYIVASGKNDGLGIALHPSEMQIKDFRKVVGVAWENGKNKSSVNLVKIGIGLNKNDLAPKVEEASQKMDNIIAFLQGKGPLRPESLNANAPTQPTTSPAPTGQLQESAANAEFDAYVDSQADFLKDFYSKLSTQLQKQGLDLSLYPEKQALFNDPVNVLKKMRRDPAFEAQWKLIDENLKTKH
jgi:hypothetical protein